MINNWDEIKWIFEPDGSLIDIYVQNVKIEDWIILINYLNTNHIVKYGPLGENKETNKIDLDYLIHFLNDKTGELELKIVSIIIDDIIINLHFFSIDEIEFDIDPKEIYSFDNYNKILDFMKKVSELLNKPLILTGENQSEFPLINVDFSKNLIKVLTKEDAEQLWKQLNPQSFKILPKINFENLSSFKMKEFQKEIIWITLLLFISYFFYNPNLTFNLSDEKTVIDINIHDTYFVIESSHILILITGLVFYFSYLLRMILKKFKNLIITSIFLFSNLLMIIITSSILQMIKLIMILPGTTIYPPLSSKPQIHKGNGLENLYSFFIILLIIFIITLILVIGKTYFTLKKNIQNSKEL